MNSSSTFQSQETGHRLESFKRMEDFQDTLRILQGTAKGKLVYQNGWDDDPNAITGLIAKVQEEEIDKPNRKILDNAFKVFDTGSRNAKTSPRNELRRGRGRHSFPENFETSRLRSKETLSPMSSSLLSSISIVKPSNSVARRAAMRFSEPRIEVEEIHDWNSDDTDGPSGEYIISGSTFAEQRALLTPPSRTVRRKKSFNGSPIFKPSPTFSSSTLTQTHSSTTSDATTATPTRNPSLPHDHGGASKKLGIHEVAYNEEKLEEDMFIESKISPFSFIENSMIKYQEELEVKLRENTQRRVEKYNENQKEADRLANELLTLELEASKREKEALKKQFIEAERANLQECQTRQQQRLKEEEKLARERKAAADAAEMSRKAAREAAERQEQLRIQQINEDQKRKEADQAANLEKQRQLKAAEEKRLADEAAAANAASIQKANEEKKKAQEVVPDLVGLILRDDILKYAKTNEILKQYEEPISHIDGKDPASKAFYIGAVKCINTPLNALADTHEQDVMKKVEHFTKLLSGEPVSGGGSMTNMFSCTSLPQGDYFVMKTLAFRFVKKSEADVTRGKSTVQPLATVGVHLCKKFPAWASLVQGNLYKLCPFLVPFSYPLGDKSMQEYARELGHDLSGTETAIQQTFLERLKGYCTLYALMVIKFHKDGPFEIGDATSFFTLGGAWQVLARTMKLEPQVDVTATVIHTLLDILDDTLYAIYKNQFVKLMRLLILTYLPKIKSITPPAKSGSVSRLQIYVEKKFAV